VIFSGDELHSIATKVSVCSSWGETVWSLSHWVCSQSVVLEASSWPQIFLTKSQVAEGSGKVKEEGARGAWSLSHALHTGVFRLGPSFGEHHMDACVPVCTSHTCPFEVLCPLCHVHEHMSIQGVQSCVQRQLTQVHLH
jgi:hypothetical protein